jgi:hypothetical protein
MEAKSRPWYKEPWPWVIIAIPLAAVIMGVITFYLAVSHPDYLVVEEEQYREIKSELHAQPQSDDDPVSAADSEAGSEDGEH